MKVMLFGIWMTFGADAASTHIALKNGATEIVMPSQNPFVLDGIAIAEASSSSYGLIWLDKHKHPKTARILGWTLIAVRGSIVVSNIEQMRKK
jgi:hypothetical protein